MASKESLERADKWLRAQAETMNFSTDFKPSHLMSLADLLDEAIREARAQAYEAAAKVIDDEIALRETPDLDHMEPIGRLAEKIREL